MNEGMRMSLGLLIQVPFYILLFWLIGKAVGPIEGVTIALVATTPLIITVFLSSWFGLLLKRRFTIINFLKYYLLSAISGIVAANAMILTVVIGAKGFRSGFEEYRKLGDEFHDNIQFPIIALSIFAALMVFCTTISLFEKPKEVEPKNPPETE